MGSSPTLWGSPRRAEGPMRSIRQAFADIPIVRKLYLGLGAILGAVLIYSAVVVSEARFLGDAIREYDATDDVTRRVEDIEDKLLEFQYRVQEYLVTFSEADARRVEAASDQLTKELAEARIQIRNPELVQIFGEIEGLKSEYGNGFERVHALHGHHVELMNNTLGAVGQRLWESIARIVDTANASSRSQALILAGKLREDLLTAFVYVTRLLAADDPAKIEQVRAEFAKAATVSGSLENTLKDPGARRAYEGFLADFAAYRRAFDELATVISEHHRIRVEIFDELGLALKEKAQAIAQSAAANKKIRNEAIADLVRKKIFKVALLAVLAVSVAAVAAGLIGGGIALPIQSITEAMRRLAAGNTAVEIPGTGRKDEIGAMADAVSVFRANLIAITQAREAAHRAIESAEKASQAKSEFLSSMSHELRTPMNAILGFSQLLAMDKTLTPIQHRQVNTILKAGGYLLKLIDDVLDLARIEAGRLILSIEDVSLAEMLFDCRSLIQPMADSKQIKLTFTPFKDPPFVRADRVRLKQAIVNLASNAVKYNRLEGEVIIAAERHGDRWIRIRVRDTGPGIPEDKQPELFKPFSRLGFEKSGIDGLGIGLALTKRMVEAMGGAIGVDSAVGKGSTFWIDLLEAASSTADDPADERVRANELPEATVLHIEDNILNTALVRETLAPYPHIRMLDAGSGSLGLELARAHLPDLVLLDINLPGIDGYEVIDRLRDDPRTRHIPVIGISAAAMPRDIERALKHGFDEYLVKPLDVSKLIATLAAHLGRKSPDAKGLRGR